MPRKRERRPEARWLRGAFWRNFQVKYREINDLHKQMLRVSADVAAMAPGAARDAATRPPLPGPVERLLLARPVRRDLHQPHAPGDVRAPDRRRGPRRRRRRARSSRPRRATSTWTGSTRCAWPTRARSSRSTSTVARASAAGTSGRSVTPWPPSCAAGPRRTTTRCCAWTMQPPRRPTARRVAARRRGDGDARSRSTTGRATRSPGSPRGSSTTRTSGDPGWCGSCRRDATPDAWAPGQATELGDAVDGAFEIVELGQRPARRRARDADDRGARRCRDEGAAARRRPAVPDAGARRGARAPWRSTDRRPARHRMDADDARRWRQPVGLVGRRAATDRARHGRHRRRT